MKVENELRARIFAAYMPCSALIADITKGRLVAIDFTDLECAYETEGNSDMIGVDAVKLILKPLTEISDEDAEHICRLLTSTPSHQLSKVDLIRERVGGDHSWTKLYIKFKASSKWQIEYRGDDFMGWTDDSGVCKTLSNHSKVIDYLRSAGYDLGYGSITSLINAGIAITD